ncbi:hypothetical protein INH39_08220 [Massilia violaceinigra]|uniref:Uncharacterized protein n=1 Tax=Massilia violaceinigra TaxID=2045208 RepID=A0ABY4AA25_9BURK|nr:hypothetical protein [Massilia violaceinigra]UOD31655.1 hypothetical protein INH39_08220 [Massilia violaceinigra]
MKRTVLALLIATACTWAHGAAATALVKQAMRCELTMGRMSAVQQALDTLPGYTSHQGAYYSKTPISLFGIPTLRISADNDKSAGDFYISVFKGAALEAIASAARLSSTGNGDFVRKTPHGTLRARIYADGEVALICRMHEGKEIAPAPL